MVKRNHVITRKRITNFLASHRVNAADAFALDRWYRTVRSKSWGTFADVRATYPAADAVGIYVVFNVGGNKYRVICEINYQHRKVDIRHVLTHAEYDRGGWMD